MSCTKLATLTISHLSMRSLNRSASDLINTDINREMMYDTVEFAVTLSRKVPLLNDDYKTIYDRIMLVVSAGQVNILF